MPTTGDTSPDGDIIRFQCSARIDLPRFKVGGSLIISAVDGSLLFSFKYDGVLSLFSPRDQAELNALQEGFHFTRKQLSGVEWDGSYGSSPILFEMKQDTQVNSKYFHADGSRLLSYPVHFLGSRVTPAEKHYAHFRELVFPNQRKNKANESKATRHEWSLAPQAAPESPASELLPVPEPPEDFRLSNQANRLRLSAEKALSKQQTEAAELMESMRKRMREYLPLPEGEKLPPRELADFSTIPELQCLAEPTPATQPPLSVADVERAGTDFACLLGERGAEPAARYDAWTRALARDAAPADAEHALRDYRLLVTQWSNRLIQQNLRCARWSSSAAVAQRDVLRTDRSKPFFTDSQPLPDDQGTPPDGLYDQLARIVPGGVSASFRPFLAAVKQYSQDGSVVPLRWFRLYSLLLTWITFDPRAGYAQGMSDLAALVMHVTATSQRYAASERALLDYVCEKARSDPSALRRDLPEDLATAMERADASAFWLFVSVMRFHPVVFSCRSATVDHFSAPAHALVRCVDADLAFTLDRFAPPLSAFSLVLLLFKRTFAEYELSERFIDWLVARGNTERTVFYGVAAFYLLHIRGEVQQEMDRFWAACAAREALRAELEAAVDGALSELESEHQRVSHEIELGLRRQCFWENLRQDPQQSGLYRFDQLTLDQSAVVAQALEPFKADVQERVDSLHTHIRGKLKSAARGQIIFDISVVNNAFQEIVTSTPEDFIHTAEALWGVGQQYGLKDSVDLEEWASGTEYCRT